MSWRFKASKYKNAAPIEPKKEKQILDLPIGSYSTGQVVVISKSVKISRCKLKTQMLNCSLQPVTTLEPVRPMWHSTGKLRGQVWPCCH